MDGDTAIWNRFAKYYDLIYQRYDYQRECAFLDQVFHEYGHGTVQRLLDVACGTGSHDVILAQRGYKVVGVDASPVMIAQANAKAAQHGVNVAYHVQDMRALQVSGPFDAALCLFGGFDYLLSDADVHAFLRGLRAVLKPDGLFLFECFNVEGLKPTPYRSWDRRVHGDTRIIRLSVSNYDPVNRVLTIDFHFVVLEQTRLIDEFSESHRLRVYAVDDVTQLLHDAGFHIEQMLVGYPGYMPSVNKPPKDLFRVFTIARWTGVTK